MRGWWLAAILLGCRPDGATGDATAGASAASVEAPRGVASRASAATTAELPADLAVWSLEACAEGWQIALTHQDGAQRAALPIAAEALEARSATLWVALRARGPVEAAARAVAEATLAPVAAPLAALVEAGVRRLAVVVPGPARGVPFEALPWGGAPLGARLAVFEAESLQALTEVLAMPQAEPPRRVLVVADAAGDLPGAVAEARAVVRLYGGGGVLLTGPAARAAAVVHALPAVHAVHLAVHGQAGGAGLWLADGALGERAFAALRLAGRPLVVLAGCETGRGEEGGLTRAFLAAGARAVVASRWPVDDAASHRLMWALHAAHRAGEPLAFALQAASQSLRVGTLAAPEVPPSAGLRSWAPSPPEDLSHPYYWAAFALRGDPR